MATSTPSKSGDKSKKDDKKTHHRHHQEPSIHSELIRLSVSSFGDTDEDRHRRKKKLFSLGHGKELTGYEIGTFTTAISQYLLASEDCVEQSGFTCCSGLCLGSPPSIEELNFMLVTKDTGSSLIHIHTSEEAFSANDFRPCVRIVINAEQKALLRLDFPPATNEKTHGDLTSEMIPVAVIDQDNELVFIFRSAITSDKGGTPSEQVTEILTADGTGFVVAKVGPLEYLMEHDLLRKSRTSSTSGTGAGTNNNNRRRSTVGGGRTRKDQFAVQFTDELLGRSWKQLIFSVSVVYFYQWLVQKAYGTRTVPRKPNPDESQGICIVC